MKRIVRKRVYPIKPGEANEATFERLDKEHSEELRRAGYLPLGTIYHLKGSSEIGPTITIAYIYLSEKKIRDKSLCQKLIEEYQKSKPTELEIPEG